MRIAVIGGVKSTDLLIRKLHDHGFGDLRTWGYAPADVHYVSGWTDLAATCSVLGIRCDPFTKVGQAEPALTDFQPDILFAVGLSQIIPRSMLQIAKLDNIGFHPTNLPRGRGRAPLAWLVLEGGSGAATFFSLREGVDDGPIYVQERFPIADADDAKSVEARVLAAEARALDRWLPLVAAGELAPIEQNHDEATWFGKRAPEDGWIDWSRPAGEIVRLIRASTAPHPGAVTVAEDTIVHLWAASVHDRPEKGVVGRILQVYQDNSFLVQAGDGLVHVLKWTADRTWKARVGVKLGYSLEREVHALRKRCEELESKLTRFESALGRDVDRLSGS